jgi:3-oxoadipate enol-lactonase
MGGMIGQTLALSSPGLFLSLALCDTSSRVPAEARPLWQERITTAETQGMEPLVEPTIGRWFTAPFRERRPDVVDPVRTRIRTTNPRGYAGCCHAISALDLTDRIGAIRLPTLIVVGEEDQGTPVAASRAIQAQIGGSRLEIIKLAAHLSNLEQPEEFTRIVTGFLAGLGLSASGGAAR